jgi:urease accessory protein
MAGLPSDFAPPGARVIPFPATPAKLERARGTARIAFARREAETWVADLYQFGCSKIGLPRQEPGQWREAVLINSAGGLTDGDRIWSRIRWEAGASAVVTSQAAERIYRSRQAAARIDSDLIVGPQATALWLPQETILFDGGRLARRTEVDLDPSARLIACESLVFGRTAMGEVVRDGGVTDIWRVRRGGRPLFADSFRLDGDLAAALDRPAVGGGARALATVLYAGPDADARIGLLRSLRPIDPATRMASSCLGGLVVTRILAATGAAVRQTLVGVLTALLGALGDATDDRRLPRVWSC